MSQPFLIFCTRRLSHPRCSKFNSRSQGLYSSTESVGKEKSMKVERLLLVLMFILTSLAWAQDTSPQSPPSTAGPGSRNQMPTGRRQQMMQMHKQQMEAMKADLEKMKSSLAEMKAKVAA